VSRPPSDRIARNALSKHIHLTLRGLLGVDGDLLAHGSEDDDVCFSESIAIPREVVCAGHVLTDVLAVVVEHLVDLFTDFVGWGLDVVLGGAVVGHEGQEAVVGDVDLCHRILAKPMPVSSHYCRLCLQAGTRGGKRSGRPCCGWMETSPPTSCR